MSEPSLTGSIAVVLVLPSADMCVTDEGNLPGFSLENVSKNTTAKSDGDGGSALSGLSFLNLSTTAACVFSQSRTYCCNGVGLFGSNVVPVTPCAGLLWASA